MLAEVFKEEFRSFYKSGNSEPDLTDKLDLLGMYVRFIKSKYDIYFNEKSKFQPSNVGADRIRERDLKNIQVEHQMLALEALFTEDQVTFLESYDRTTFSDEDLAMIGIAQSNNEGKPHFIHRTFAEYFVADFLINQLTKKTKQHVQVKELLLNEVLSRLGFHVIRAFMDGMLKNSRPSKEALREYGGLLNEECNQGECDVLPMIHKDRLYFAAREDNVRIIGFLLDSLHSRQHSNYINIMLTEGGRLRRFWHTAAQYNRVKALEKLWEWAEIVAPTQTYSLLLSQDTDSRTALRRAIEDGKIELAEKLWCWAKPKMTRADLKNELCLRHDGSGINAWHNVKIGRVNMLVKMWDWAKELHIQPEELRNEVWLLKDTDGKTVWHMAAEIGEVELLEKIWDRAKELQLKPEELRNDVCLLKDKDGKTVWHIAAKFGDVEVLEKLWDWAKELHIQPEELRNEVWLSKGKYGKTVWHIAAE
jgi:hypothetical protein